MNGGGNEDTFSERAGALEHYVAEKFALGFIKEIILTSGGIDAEAFVADHVCNGVAVNAGSVDNKFCFDLFAVFSGDNKVSVFFFNGSNFPAKFEFNAVFNCLFAHCKSKFPGIYDSCGGSKKSAYTVFGNVGFHLADFFSGKNFLIRNAVCNASVIKFFYGFHFLFAESKNKGTAAFERNVKFLTDFAGHFITRSVIFCHKGSGFRVIACVDDSTVCTGGAHCHIVFFFDQYCLAVIAGEFSCNSAADNSGTDHSNVIDQFIKSPFSNKKARKERQMGKNAFQMPPFVLLKVAHILTP